MTEILNVAKKKLPKVPDPEFAEGCAEIFSYMEGHCD